MKTTASLLRAIGFSILGFLILLLTVDSAEQWAFGKYPFLWIVLGVFILFVVAAEMLLAAYTGCYLKPLIRNSKNHIRLKKQKERKISLHGLSKNMQPC